MKKQTIIFIIVLILLGILTVRNAKAEAPIADMSVPASIQDDPVKVFAYNQVKYKWGNGFWESFNNIIQHESEWDCNSKNPTSSAYGLGQLLDSTRKWLKMEKTSDCYIQVDQAITYISKVYGEPNEAWRIWQTKRWY